MTRRPAARPDGGGGRANGSQLANPPLLLVSGATATIRKYASHPHLGRLIQPRNGNSISEIAMSGMFWAADNDALAGIDPDAYLGMLDDIAAQDRTRLLFVAVPDGVEMTPDGPRGDWNGTLWLWRSWRRALERRDLPGALVLQDGATVEAVPWGDPLLRALFIGGSTAWKLGPEAAALVDEGKRRGLWIHCGRVNSARRERYVLAIGCDSFDGGQYSMFPETHIPACLKRLEHEQMVLEGML